VGHSNGQASCPIIRVRPRRQGESL
jgi:hypothetical protein